MITTTQIKGQPDEDDAASVETTSRLIFPKNERLVRYVQTGVFLQQVHPNSTILLVDLCGLAGLMLLTQGCT